MSPGAWAQTPEAAHVIKVHDRKPLAVLISTPTGAAGKASRSEIINEVADKLEQYTDFSLQLVSNNFLSDCRGRLACVVLKIRQDYDADSREFKLTSQNYQKDSYPRYLLVVSNLTLEGEADRISALMVDTERALELYHYAGKDEPEWEDTLESQISQQAQLGRLFKAEVSSREQTLRFIDDLFIQQIRRPLTSANHWKPYGELQINVPVAGMGIDLDGRTVGTTQAGISLLKGLLPGRHQIKLHKPGYASKNFEVKIQRQKTATIQPELEVIADGSPLPGQLMLYGGIATVVAGGVLTAIALGRQDGNLSTVCFKTESNSCETNQSFQTLDYTSDRDISANNLNPDGLLLAPLGYSLMLSGAVWGTGALISEENDSPWWYLLGGIAAGGLAYGLSAALNGQGLP